LDGRSGVEWSGVESLDALPDVIDDSRVPSYQWESKTGSLDETSSLIYYYYYYYY